MAMAMGLLGGPTETPEAPPAAAAEQPAEAALPPEAAESEASAGFGFDLEEAV